jgi:hypothetical protein
MAGMGSSPNDRHWGLGIVGYGNPAGKYEKSRGRADIFAGDGKP